MADNIKPSAEWELHAVVERLQKNTAPGKPVSANVFIKDTVPTEELSAKVQEIVDDATTKLNLAPNSVKIGKVRPSSRSFSVTSDEPSFFDQIAKRGEVETMLEFTAVGHLSQTEKPQNDTLRWRTLSTRPSCAFQLYPGAQQKLRDGT